MRSCILTGLLLFITLAPLPAKAVERSPNLKDDYATAETLQAALKNGDKDQVASLISYPLGRDYPLPPIENAKDFIVHWDEFFDAARIKSLTDATPEEVGWRGVMLEQGCVWFEDAKITSLNCKTAAYDEIWKKAREVEGQGLYKTAQGYDRIAIKCETKSLQVRMQYHGDDLRYFVWKKGQDTKEKPQLELHNGIYEPQGSGGNLNLIFTNPPYTYDLYIANLCGEDCNNYLTVSEGEKEISRSVCK